MLLKDCFMPAKNCKRVWSITKLNLVFDKPEFLFYNKIGVIGWR